MFVIMSGKVRHGTHTVDYDTQAARTHALLTRSTVFPDTLSVLCSGVTLYLRIVQPKSRVLTKCRDPVFYIRLRQQARVESNEELLGVAKKGDFFGELSVLVDRTSMRTARSYTRSAAAISLCEVARLVLNTNT